VPPFALGVVVPPDLPDDLFVPYIRRADSLGFAELWVVEDCFQRGGIAQAAVVLASTPRIRVGIGILPAGARNVAFAAMEISTLARLFPGRLLVGVGHGMPNWMQQVGARPASPLTLLGEYIPAIKAILAGENTTVDGRFVKVRDVQLAQAPQRPPPIFAGVRGPKSLALSGRVADGTVLAEPVTPEYLGFVRQQLANPASGHEIVAYNIAVVDKSPEVARNVARTALAWIGDPDWAPHIAPLPFAADFVALRAASTSREEFAARLPDEWVDQLAIVGAPSDAKRRLAQLSAAGANHLIMIPAGTQPMDALEALGSVLEPPLVADSP
jgi:5,10-methylenetetrahydromethanopterin reductase